ncbi:hypothetical protein BJX62DRAFT_243914 [Aspergillus germanicus]
MPWPDIQNIYPFAAQSVTALLMVTAAQLESNAAAAFAFQTHKTAAQPPKTVFREIIALFTKTESGAVLLGRVAFKSREKWP